MFWAKKRRRLVRTYLVIFVMHIVSCSRELFIESLDDFHLENAKQFLPVLLRGRVVQGNWQCNDVVEDFQSFVLEDES